MRDVDMRVTFTDTDLVKLEFFQDGKRVLWVDLTRDKARDWGDMIAKAAGQYWQAPKPTT